MLENQHEIRKIDHNKEILHNIEKGRTIDNIERYNFYKETKNGTQIKDKNTVKTNKICETIKQGEADRLRLRNRPNTGFTYKQTRSSTHWISIQDRHTESLIAESMTKYATWQRTSPYTASS